MDTLAMTTWAFPPPPATAMPADWPARYWLVMLAMWWIMMIAMMLPGAAPTVLLYLRVRRHHGGGEAAGASAAPFVAGYLVAWLLFSLLATALQWGLERAGLVHGMWMWSSSNVLSAAFLCTAGTYQFTALKHGCLARCRSPAAWLAANWRRGGGGALRMGLEHGVYCVGCCWSLMLLLFVGGVMNLVWIAGLALVVLLEKLLPRGDRVARVLGFVMLIAGVYLLLAA